MEQAKRFSRKGSKLTSNTGKLSPQCIRLSSFYFLDQFFPLSVIHEFSASKTSQMWFQNSGTRTQNSQQKFICYPCDSSTDCNLRITTSFLCYLFCVVHYHLCVSDSSMTDLGWLFTTTHPMA